MHPAKPRSDGIPQSFRLAAHTIHVVNVPKKKWKHGADCVGIWLPGQYRIEILASLRGTNRQQTFVHEMLHAVFDIAGFEDLSRNEAMIDSLAHLLAQALITFED